MRALPISMARRPDDPRHECRALYCITHADLRCVSACIAFNVIAAAMIQDGAAPETAVALARDVSDLDDRVTEVLEARGIWIVAAPLEPGRHRVRAARA